jgi:hypothetical protein
MARRASGYAVTDGRGALLLYALAFDRGAVRRAAQEVYGPDQPVRVSRAHIATVRASIEMWENGFSTDKAVDLTGNKGRADL